MYTAPRQSWITAAWLQLRHNCGHSDFWGAALTHSLAAVLRHEDVVHGSHVDVIRRRLPLAARFKEFLNCRDITYFHCELLKRENAKVQG